MVTMLAAAGGATSVANRAMPMLTGTASTMPISEISTVPQTKARMPNLPLGGIQSVAKK